MPDPLTENEQWILSFYRTSEINGALFFGRLARAMKPGPIQRDMTKHFSDESRHAWYWTECINRFGADPLKLSQAYQDKYLEASGIPANIMEVLALTQTFEKRVIAQYARHSRVSGLQPEVLETFNKIIDDEKWHIEWVGQALKGMEGEYGRDTIAQALERYRKADAEVYGAVLKEHEQRIADLMRGRGDMPEGKGPGPWPT
jgi:bacterioferritin (cytochrome b1)